MTISNPVDQPFRRLFAGFDRDVEPPVDLATRLRLRVLAEAELDNPVDRLPVRAPGQASTPAPGTPVRLAPASQANPLPAPAAPRPVAPAVDGPGHRRQPWWLIALETAAGLLLLMGAAVTLIRLTDEPDRSNPRLGSSITAVASPSSEPQLLWERTDPDLMGTGDLAAGDDLVVRSVQDEQKSGFLWFEQYEYTSYLQALDRRSGEERWLTHVDGFGATYVTADAVLYVSYPNQEGGSTSLTAFSQADGSQLWRTELPAPPAYFADDLATRDNLVYLLATYDASVRAYDLTTGAEVWATSIGDPPGGDPSTYVAAYVSAATLTLDDDRLLTLDPLGAVVELDAATGVILATHPVTVTLPRVIYEGRLFVSADRLVTVVTGTDEETVDGQTADFQPPRTVLRISAVDRATGVESWSAEESGDIALVVEAGGRLVLWTFQEMFVENEPPLVEASTIRSLDLRTGAELWSAPQPAGYPLVSYDGATTSDGQLLIGAMAGDVVSLDLATGAELWRYDVGDLLQMPPTVTGGLALTSDRPDHLIAIAIPENEQ